MKPTTTKKKPQNGLGDVYRPASKAKSLNVDTPDSMSFEIHEALKRLENKVGNIDTYVMQKLAYSNMSDLQKSLSAEQIDGVEAGESHVAQIIQYDNVGVAAVFLELAC